MSSREHAPVFVDGSTPSAADGGPARHEPQRARRVATRLCEGFVAHDRRDGDACFEAFRAVDEAQFPHLSEREVDRAAAAFVAALWEKDAVERPYVEGDQVTDPAGLDDADWQRVRQWLERRAVAVGMDEAYAHETTTAWRRHKTGGDYWTPTMAAQRRELAAALGTGYPDKPRFGEDGFGHLPTRYLTAVELHDMRSDTHWEAAVDVMTGYFSFLFDRQEGDR